MTEFTMLLGEGKRRAFERRQQDIGWGRVFAHIIPFYGIYYAISRRTITPFVCSFGLSICSAFLYAGMVNSWTGFTQITRDTIVGEIEEKGEKKLENDPFSSIVSFVMSIIGTKYGIDRARKSAHLDLKAED